LTNGGGGPWARRFLKGIKGSRENAAMTQRGDERGNPFSPFIQKRSYGYASEYHSAISREDEIEKWDRAASKKARKIKRRKPIVCVRKSKKQGTCLDGESKKDRVQQKRERTGAG